MNYRKDKYGNDLSILGFGCMRFARKMGKVDMEKTEEQILFAIEKGINYFDSAYIYPGSEAALGEILEKHHLRDKVKIATKLPHYLIKSVEGAEKLFQEELKRLRTDHVDYYLMHMLTDTDTWEALGEMGIRHWLEEKKRLGQIRQLGFSYHGNSHAFCNLVDAYDWDFCMIQYNYMDENSQAGRTGLCHAHQKGLPVMIMEPLRGGKLVKGLPEKARKIFSESQSDLSPAAHAFRWLWNQKEVAVVLSGMNSMEMLKDNIACAENSEIGMLTEQDEAMLKRVVEAIQEKMKVGCTGCGYCMPCPKGVDIPGTFAAYNRRYSEKKINGLIDYFMCTALRKNASVASACTQCGKCEKHCPQEISIREHLKDAVKEMEGPVFKTAHKLVKKFTKF